MPENRPTVFLGSSAEGLQIAEAIQMNLDYTCDTTIWSQGVFGLGQGTLEALVDSLESFDFAILILTPDDLVESRTVTKQSPRDNVLLELGLFTGALGRRRTFIVYDRIADIKIPSDLAGVTSATYQPRSNGNIQAALGAASTQIKGAISQLGRRGAASIATGRAFDYGIQALFNMQETQEMHIRNQITIEIINRGTQFSLLTETGASYIDPSLRRHWDFLKEKLEQGTQFRFLLIDPFCDAKKLRNRLNGVTNHIDPKYRLDLVRKLCEKYSNVELRFTDQTYCALFFSESEMVYDPYHLGTLADRLENYSFAIHIKKVELTQPSFPYYAFFQSHFERLWEDAMKLSEFMKTYEFNLKGTAFENASF